jgi:hypothetical protein
MSHGHILLSCALAAYAQACWDSEAAVPDAVGGGARETGAAGGASSAGGSSGSELPALPTRSGGCDCTPMPGDPLGVELTRECFCDVAFSLASRACPLSLDAALETLDAACGTGTTQLANCGELIALGSSTLYGASYRFFDSATGDFAGGYVAVDNPFPTCDALALTTGSYRFPLDGCSMCSVCPGSADSCERDERGLPMAPR